MAQGEESALDALCRVAASGGAVLVDGEGHTRLVEREHPDREFDPVAAMRARLGLEEVTPRGER